MCLILAIAQEFRNFQQKLTCLLENPRLFIAVQLQPPEMAVDLCHRIMLYNYYMCLLLCMLGIICMCKWDVYLEDISFTKGCCLQSGVLWTDIISCSSCMWWAVTDLDTICYGYVYCAQYILGKHLLEIICYRLLKGRCPRRLPMPPSDASWLSSSTLLTIPITTPLGLCCITSAFYYVHFQPFNRSRQDTALLATKP